MPNPLLARLASKAGGRKGPSRCIGLDIGGFSVKGLKLHRTDQQLQVLQAETVEIPSVWDVTRRTNAIRKLVESLGAPETPVVAAVGGPGTVLRRVSLPKMSPQELQSALSFEAEKYIPFKLEEVFLDFAVLEDRSTGPMEVLLAAARRETVNDLVGLLSPCGVTPLAVDLETTALANAWEAIPAEGKGGVAALLHVGGRGTILDFVRESQLEFAREINIGGVAFTAAISEGLRLDAAEAERIKCQPAARAAEVRTALQPSWEQWLSQCRGSFDFYEDQSGRRVEGLILSGGGAQMSGFMEWVQEASGLPTHLWDPMGKGPSFAVAVGLALRGVRS